MLSMGFKGRILSGMLLLAAAAGCQQVIAPAELGENVKLPGIYTDNMVFQQQQPLVFKGICTPGKKVSIEFNGKKAIATADANGEWLAKLPEMKAGGPYEVKIQGKDTIILKNVMVGEVWVCSGQSNMEWKMGNSDNADKETAAADYPDIRLFQVARNPSPGVVLSDVKGSWAVCSPATVRSFSGVGYYFGRKLYQDLKIPVGLINSSVGGTRVEAWMPATAFEKNPSYANLATEARKIPATVKLTADDRDKQFLQSATVWLAELETTHKAEVEKAKSYASATAAETANWKSLNFPGTFDGQPNMDIDGVVWFSKTVDVPADWAGKDLTLSLGVIDDCDMTWFNGEKVGQTWLDVKSHWTAKRTYAIPGKLVKAGANTINVRLLDHAYAGGIMGPDLTLALTGDAKAAKIDLAGAWKYNLEFAIDYKKEKRRPNPPTDGSSTNYASTLYNGMINGITFFPVRGAIWYQGESNVGNRNEYKTLFPDMINSWREAWNNPDMGFFFVQLAAFYKHSPKEQLPADFFAKMAPDDHQWARTREIQMEALKLKNTGVAIAIEVGNPVDIHPTNKQDVGLRLALAAEKAIYGKDIVYSGPVYDRMVADKGSIRIYFTQLGSGLLAKNGELKQFAIAGKDQVFHWATAKIDGDTIVVSSPEVKEPVAVRYAWSTYPEGCNLYNKEMLPAGPFRTDNW